MPSTMSSEVSMPRASSIVMTPSLPTLSIASAMIRPIASSWRSEEHTSELQSPCNLVCRLLLEKKKKRCHRHPVHRRRHQHQATVIHLPHQHVEPDPSGRWGGVAGESCFQPVEVRCPDLSHPSV